MFDHLAGLVDDVLGSAVWPCSCYACEDCEDLLLLHAVGVDGGALRSLVVFVMRCCIDSTSNAVSINIMLAVHICIMQLSSAPMMNKLAADWCS